MYLPVVWKLNIFTTFSLSDLRGQVTGEHDKKKKEEFEKGPKASEGYGGKFGVMTDRMDSVSVN